MYHVLAAMQEMNTSQIRAQILLRSQRLKKVIAIDKLTKKIVKY